MTNGGLILSGGPDSAFAAWDSVQSYPDTDWRAFHFSYGQLALPERQCAEEQAQELGIPFRHITIPDGMLTSVMTQDGENRVEGLDIEPTFVPGRNALFITMVASMIYEAGRPLQIVGGWNAVDYSGYPDCRPEFLTQQANALTSALDCQVTIIAPAIRLTKKDIILRAHLGGVPLHLTWSCYSPRITEDGWAHACHQCPSCEFRDKGFKDAGLEDPCQEWDLRRGE